MFEASSDTAAQTDLLETNYRSSSQPLLPQRMDVAKSDGYQLYPYHPLGEGKIFSGYASLAAWMATQRQVMIDGYGGVLWQEVKDCLQKIFDQSGLRVHWTDIRKLMKPAAAVQAMVEPFLGASGSLWGTKCSLSLEDFFDAEAIGKLQPDDAADLTIVYGTGAALAAWNAPLAYLDVPKNEVQYRMRAGSILNLGCEKALEPAAAYKRFYFVDWVLLNAHKKKILDQISLIGDTQWKRSLNWAFSEIVRAGLTAMSQNSFRVRPWFEAGAWGGQWMKAHLDGISQQEINYAWSFEMIVPENGLVLESDGYLLEISFDFLMFAHGASVLGKHAPVFGDLFPIRFDFLDTWDGGNLSIQCHPSLSYIQQKFGEQITQDETYYILDCKNDAQVYLGFQEGISAEEFRHELEESRDKHRAVQIGRYVQAHRARQHDLFLIPHGTVHSAGAGNLVLEISATPYIFTFKMYDWLRMDLNGKPRAINIEHAFNNLNFDRNGERVKQELISQPSILEEGAGWKLVHLPTHPDHFYDVHRLEFTSELRIDTNDLCHVLMLVEGSSIMVKTASGPVARYHYAETFAIPAAAKSYTLVNKGNSMARVIKAFVKDDFTEIKTSYEAPRL